MVAHLDLKSLIEILKINMNKEIWLDLIDNPEKYLISNLGRVKCKKFNKVLKARIERQYMRLTITNKDNQRRTITIHRSLYLSFNPNTNLLFHIHHIDEDKLNNRLENLTAMNGSDHIKMHRLKHKLRKCLK
jgi:hypothetical protein